MRLFGPTCHKYWVSRSYPGPIFQLNIYLQDNGLTQLPLCDHKHFREDPGQSFQHLQFGGDSVIDFYVLKYYTYDGRYKQGSSKDLARLWPVWRMQNVSPSCWGRSVLITPQLWCRHWQSTYCFLSRGTELYIWYLLSNTWWCLGNVLSWLSARCYQILFRLPGSHYLCIRLSFFLSWKPMLILLAPSHPVFKRFISGPNKLYLKY